MTTSRLPATYWADSTTHARRMQHAAERYASRLEERTTDPRDHLAGGLLRDRIRAALAEAQAWEDYADQAERCFADAADDEMRRADDLDAAVRKLQARAHYEDVARQAAQYERRHRYDTTTCPHGCCPDAVCNFTNDCPSHQAAAS